MWSTKNIYNIKSSLIIGLTLSGSALLISAIATSVAAQSTAPVTLTVKKVEISLTELRDIGLDLKHVLSACRHLYDEVTLQPVTMQTEPEMIANGVLISIPIGVQPVGPPAQPRKERVDLLMSEIGPIITLLKKNVDEFVSENRQLDLPDDLRSEINPQLSQWIQLVNDVSGQLARLQLLTQGPPYDNDAIASTVSAIEQEVKQLDEIRKTTYKSVRKEGKHLN